MQPDIDALSRAAQDSGGSMDSLRTLAKAIFSLPSWIFIARGDPTSPTPYVASHAATAGGVPMIRAFTDMDRLQRFARENGLLEPDGGVLALTIPVEGGDIVSYLEGFMQYGAEGLWFNSDAGSDGFFFPLKQLRPIRDDVMKTRATS